MTDIDWKFRAEALEVALRDAAYNGLIYWEPNTRCAHERKAMMLARIERALAATRAPEVSP